MGSSDTEDAMLRAAIAASLRDSRPQSQTAEATSPPAQSEVVDLTIDSDSDKEADVKQVFPKSKSVVGSDTDNSADEEDDEDLRAALALSLEGVHPDSDDDESATTQATEKPANAPELSQLSSFLGMDRKKMEEERLARLAKRKADNGDGSLGPRPAKATKVEAIEIPDADDSDRPTPHATSSREVPTPAICNQFAANDRQCGVKPTARPIPQWPLGAVKKTVVSMVPRTYNDITLEEVLQHGDLELAVLSSFMWDMEWLFSKMNTWQTRFILVMHAKEEQTRRQFEEETAAMTNIRLCFPPMDGQINCMHSKLMLLFHPDYLRIAVPTANLTATDWGENNLMENTVFLIDLPKKAEKDMPPNSKPAFYHDLVYYLKATTLHENIIRKLESFDFSKTARYAFVHSIGGPHRDEAWKRTGYCGLGRAVTNLGLRSVAPIKVDYVTSSVGSLTGDMLRAIHLACKGDDGLTDYTLRYSKNPFTTQTEDPSRTIMLKSAKEWMDRFHVYFPSEKTVRETHNQPQLTAGTICFRSSWWERETFPHRVMRDCEGERGVLMHNKLIYVSPSKPILLPNRTKCKGWAYVGSANLSESAWGRLVKDRETKQPRLNCRNWECGVIVPIISECTDADLKANTDTPEKDQSGPSGPLPSVHQRLARVDFEESMVGRFPHEIFRDTVPVPMKIPAKEFSRGSDKDSPGYRKPWFLNLE